MTEQQEQQEQPKHQTAFEGEGGGGGGIAAKLARPNILDLLPYRCARDDYTSGIALLDANENAFGSPLFNGETAATTTTTTTISYNDLLLHRYPDPHQIELKQKVGAFRNGIGPEQIFVGVGSDEAIDLLVRIFCKPGHDQIMTTPPTYGMYKVCAKINDVDIVNVPLTPQFDLQVDQMIETAQNNPRIKLIFVCSPGNPTCKAISLDDIETLAQACADTALVVVDEAYVDFCPPEASALQLIRNKNNNVCVLQTLSKAFGLANLRCGFLFAAPDVISLMNNVKAPYNMNGLTSRTAMMAFDNIELVQRNVQNLLEQRRIVMEALQALPSVELVYPSDSNFILFRLTKEYNAESIYKTMADEGIVTRYRGNELHCHNCIRVTVGTATENQAFLAMLKKTTAHSP